MRRLLAESHSPPEVRRRKLFQSRRMLMGLIVTVFLDARDGLLRAKRGSRA